MRAFLTVSRRDPADVIAHNNMALVYYKIGMLEEAMKEFNIALNLNPSYSESHYNLGNLYLCKGLKEEAPPSPSIPSCPFAVPFSVYHSLSYREVYGKGSPFTSLALNLNLSAVSLGNPLRYWQPQACTWNLTP